MICGLLILFSQSSYKRLIRTSQLLSSNLFPPFPSLPRTTWEGHIFNLRLRKLFHHFFLRADWLLRMKSYDTNDSSSSAQLCIMWRNHLIPSKYSTQGKQSHALITGVCECCANNELSHVTKRKAGETCNHDSNRYHQMKPFDITLNHSSALHSSIQFSPSIKFDIGWQAIFSPTDI